MPPYKPVTIGEKYGCYTVICKSDKKGNQEFYNVRCNCGHITVIGKSRIFSLPEKCRMCSGKEYTSMMHEKRKENIGEIINGFKIIDIAPDRNDSTARYIAECTICGNRRVRTFSSMKCKKGERCEACPPDYGFIINNDIAIGHIADGTEFKIDAEDIPIIEKNSWYINGGGYLFHRDSKTRKPIRMHRAVLGLTHEDKTVVDHINHNKTDNRKCNLRIVSQAENCMNNIQRSSNTNGFTGVHISKNGDVFTGIIEQGGNRFELIKTHSIEDASQAYNVAADYLFGVGIGYRNRVMYPSQKFTCDIIEKIKAIQKESK